MSSSNTNKFNDSNDFKDSPFKLSTCSTTSSKSKHRVRIDSISRDMFHDERLHTVEPQQNVDDGTVSPSTRSSGSPPPLKQIRRNRTISGSKSEDHFLTMPSGQKVYTKGRPSWFDKAGKLLQKPYVIGICGGSASGKTTVARKIIERLEMPWVTVLSMDSFYKVLNKEQREKANNADYNFDHPDAFDFDLLETTLERLREGKSVEVPVYDFSTHSRDKNSKLMYGADVIIFEGILSLFRPKIVEMMDLKIFVDTDSDTRLARRIMRDTCERARDLDGVIDQYLKFVKPAYESFIEPASKVADLIVPRGGSNKVAIELIVRQVKNQLESRGYDSTRARNDIEPFDFPVGTPEHLCVVEPTPQVIGLQTIMRNRDTPRDELIFVAERLMQILVEKALEYVNYEEIEVETPNSDRYVGCRRNEDICGISIMRAGETLEKSLRQVIKDCKIGKILIQNNQITNEAELHYLRFPKHVDGYKVMLMDAVVASGSASIMAIRILLDHDVKEENITLLSLLSSEQGVHSIAYAFPKVRIITTAVDKKINKFGMIIPGLGDFGDRYYGTDAVGHSSSDEEDIDDDAVMSEPFISNQNLQIDVQSQSSSIDSAINSGGPMLEMQEVVTA